MDGPLRSALRGMVGRCRPLLEADLRRQLEGEYGIRPDGTIEREDSLTHLDARGRAARQRMVEAIAHEESRGASWRDAIARFTRECAFTVLNRLAALKVMEAPQLRLIAESVGRLADSSAFTQFRLVSPAAVESQPDGGYRLYLELLFDDLAEEVGVLFDRRLPQALLFPSPATLKDVLGYLNRPDVAAAWSDPETLGWIYQYYTPREQREQARKESQAPRNSYELAFRNQFYTPRYVVEFLVDNTLGRLWYEMRQGDTRLKDECRYLVRRPDEVFSRRQMRDPRDLKILDPACGSGHFLLCCFDLLRTIYDEAYGDPEVGPALQRDYPDRGLYGRAVPELILRHNLFGIDIDLRSTQIAALVLWLRAQRAYGDLSIRVADRPRIRRVNIVCAEPMPGEADLFQEFLSTLHPPVLQGLLRAVWRRMQLADEAGSLLKVEQELRDAIAAAQRAWLTMPQYQQASLPGLRAPQPVQGRLELDLSGITDEQFWEEVEGRALEALRAYAAQAAGRGYQRRLFVDDAERGFAFVDVCRQRYDVALMNPPFGESSKPAKGYIEQAYPRTKNDVYAAFVERGLGWLHPHGLLGAITSRTGFFLSSFQKWREEILLGEARPTVFADLGYGVLDTAMVETAAYCLERVDPAANVRSAGGKARSREGASVT